MEKYYFKKFENNKFYPLMSIPNINIMDEEEILEEMKYIRELLLYINNDVKALSDIQKRLMKMKSRMQLLKNI